VDCGGPPSVSLGLGSHRPVSLWHDRVENPSQFQGNLFAGYGTTHLIIMLLFFLINLIQAQLLPHLIGRKQFGKLPRRRNSAGQHQVGPQEKLEAREPIKIDSLFFFSSTHDRLENKWEFFSPNGNFLFFYIQPKPEGELKVET
jgi:hypothetical protein